MKLRVAVTRGYAVLSANGYAGSAVVQAARIADSPELRRVLAANTSTYLALIVADDVFASMNDEEISSDFQQVIFHSHSTVSVAGWLYMPTGLGRTSAPVPRADSSPDESPASERLLVTVTTPARPTNFPELDAQSASHSRPGGAGEEWSSPGDLSLDSPMQAAIAVHLRMLVESPPDELPVMIYLARDSGHADTELLIREILEELGYGIEHSFPPILGSWMRSLRGRARKAATSDAAQEIYSEVRRAIELQSLHLPQAKVDEQRGTTAAKLIESLHGQERAVILLGSILLVKDQGMIAVRELNHREMHSLEHRPSLFEDPVKMLSALQLHADLGDDQISGRRALDSGDT